MDQKKFKRLKVGDHVTLAVALPEFSCGHKTPDGKVYVPVATKGVVGAVNVPGVSRGVFHCIDFHFRPLFVDRDGNPADHWQRKDRPAVFRVAVSDPAQLV